MKFFFRSLFIFLLLFSVTTSVGAVERKKLILVLHSYHQGLEWTDNITSGIKSVFDPLQKSYEVHYEYLDTKRNSGKEYLAEVSRFIAEKNRAIRYQAIIVSDNNALALLNDGKLTFQGNPPVIFCGINNYNESLTDHLEWVTGVAETTDHQATIDLIMELHPQRKQILVVLDRTVTGNAIREEFRSIEEDYKGKLSFEFLREFSLQDIPQILSRLDDDDAVYLLTLNQDRDGNFISYAEGIEMLSQSTNVPMYGSWDFYLGKGIIGGRITSGYLQGETAAKIALRVLQGYDIRAVKVVRESPTEYEFDYPVLRKHGIDSSRLPEGHRIINAPPSSYEKHKTLLIGLTGASFFIALFLSWKFVRQKAILEERKAQALELEKKVLERTQELEQANLKLQKLSGIDGLTQLHNRRYFDSILKKEINRLQRTSSPISLLICDIDYFKNYNDTYGHLAGDDCIKMVATTIQQNCKRVTDVAARYGGEEFGVILPNTTAEPALDIAESIRKDIEARNIAHETSEIKDIVSISIGIASIMPDVQTEPSLLISIADKALYESKKNGRDRVTLLENPDNTSSNFTLLRFSSKGTDGPGE